MVKKTVSYLMVIFIALMMALNYTLFVFPNKFAPAGVNGIFTMIQDMLHFKLSYTSILLNVPLTIVVFFCISRPFALRSLLYTLCFSGFLMVLEIPAVAQLIAPLKYSTDVSKLLGPAVAGMITGFGGYYMHRIGACYGGTEFVAKLIHKRNPAVNFFSIIFGLNVSVAVVSYFVYGNIEAVLMCIIYSYFSSNIRDTQNQKHNSALRCEIVTTQPEELSRDIIEILHHSATAFDGKGMYTGQERTVLVCVINSSQLTELVKLVEKYPESFVTVSRVNRVLGNFKHMDSSNRPTRVLYDSGKK